MQLIPTIHLLTCDECHKETKFGLISFMDQFRDNEVYVCMECLAKATQILQDAIYQAEMKSFNR